MDTSFKVGDIVKDTVTKQFGTIVRKNITWVDTDGQPHFWDYEIMLPDNQLYLADSGELDLAYHA